VAYQISRILRWQHTGAQPLPPRQRSRWAATMVSSTTRTPERRWSQSSAAQRRRRTSGRHTACRAAQGTHGRAVQDTSAHTAAAHSHGGSSAPPGSGSARQGAPEQPYPTPMTAQRAAAAGAARGQHREQTKSSGVGASSGMPPQRACDQRAQVSHAIMHWPSSSRVPHSQATTQSSAPPAGARAPGSALAGARAGPHAALAGGPPGRRRRLAARSAGASAARRATRRCPRRTSRVPGAQPLPRAAARGGHEQLYAQAR